MEISICKMLIKLGKLAEDNPDAKVFYMERHKDWDVVAGTRMEYPDGTRECVADGAEPAKPDGTPTRREIWITAPEDQQDITRGAYDKSEAAALTDHKY